MATLVRAIAAVVLAVFAVSCDETPTSPTDQPFSVTDLRPGTGAIALNGSLVLVNYTGWLYNPRFADNKGGMFETSIGGSPFAFVIGDDEVIRGWDLGVAGMAVGGLRRLIIPPSLAYGDERNGIIPPYSTLIFEIELVAIADDAEGSGQ